MVQNTEYIEVCTHTAAVWSASTPLFSLAFTPCEAREASVDQACLHPWLARLVKVVMAVRTMKA